MVSVRAEDASAMSSRRWKCDYLRSIGAVFTVRDLRIKTLMALFGKGLGRTPKTPTGTA